MVGSLYCTLEPLAKTQSALRPSGESGHFMVAAVGDIDFARADTSKCVMPLVFVDALRNTSQRCKLKLICGRGGVLKAG